MANVQQIQISLNTSSPELTKQGVEQILTQCGGKWRDCRRKAYNIYACKLPANYVYANCLEQTESYNAIMKRFKRPIVPVSAIEKVPGAMDFLKQNGCYVTSQEKITLCGTQGEMWEVKLEKLVSSYTLPDGSAIDTNNLSIGKWFVISRAGSNVATEVGVQIPYKYFVQIVLSWGTVYLNNPRSKGHCKGDILVFPKGPDGGPDYTKSCSPINNSVFALTFDQTVGGWGRSGCIVPLEKTQSNAPTMETLTKITTGMTGGTTFKGVNPIPDSIKSSLNSLRGLISIGVDDFEHSLANSNENTAPTLAEYKTALTTAWGKSQDFLDNAVLKAIPSNFYKDYVGNLCMSETTENWQWQSSLVTHFVHEGFANALYKYMQTKDCIGIIRSSHILGLMDIRLMNVVAAFNGKMEADNKIYYMVNLQNVYAAGCSTAKGKSMSGSFFAAYVIDKQKYSTSIAIVPDTANITPALMDKYAVAISASGDTYDAYIKNVTDAIIKNKQIWGKYIAVSSDINRMVYNRIAVNISHYYAHLLTQESYATIQEIISLTNMTTTEDVNKKYVNGIAIPLTFNVMKDGEEGDVSANTRQLRVKFDSEKSSIAFKIQFEGETFDKSYKLNPKNNITVVILRAYMNMCNILHVHPGKMFFSSSKIWNNFLLPQAAMMLSNELPSVPLLKCKGIKPKDFFVYINLGIYSADGKKEMGTRVLRVELNYKNFDVNNSSNANVARVAEAADDVSIFEAMSIKIAFQNMKSHRPDVNEFTAVQEVPFVLAFELKFLLEELIGGTKKYAALGGASK